MGKQEMPTPTPGHAQLERLTGVWEGEETMHPSPWAPEGSTATGRTEGRLALGGFAVLIDYSQRRDDGEVSFTGHGVYTYDPKEDRITLHWFDCMGSPPEVFHGRFDGDVLVVAHGGPGMHARMTYDFRTPGQVLSRMEMSEDGDRWTVMFDGRYTIST